MDKQLAGTVAMAAGTTVPRWGMLLRHDTCPNKLKWGRPRHLPRALVQRRELGSTQAQACLRGPLPGQLSTVCENSTVLTGFQDCVLSDQLEASQAPLYTSAVLWMAIGACESISSPRICMPYGMHMCAQRGARSHTLPPLSTGVTIWAYLNGDCNSQRSARHSICGIARAGACGAQ